MGLKRTFKYLILLLFIAVLLGASFEEIIQDKKKQVEICEKNILESKNSISKLNKTLEQINIQIDSIESGLAALNSFLKNYENETYMTPEQIAIETNMIIYLAEEVERIQESFKQKVISLYKHGEHYELELLLSSKTPNEYLRRNQYLQKFSQNRKKELRELKAKKFILEEKKRMVSLSTSSKVIYIQSKRKEKSQMETNLQILKNSKSAIETDIAKNQEKILRNELQIKNINNFIKNFEDYRDKFTEKKYNRINYSSADLNLVKGNINLPVDIGLITLPFGYVSDNKTLSEYFHNGVNFSIAKGSKVYAIASGTVSLVSEAPYYGKTVIIKHENGFASVYSSLSEVNVEIGENVKLNQIIGKTGETLDGQEFHFEFWQGTTPVNPREWLRF